MGISRPAVIFDRDGTLASCQRHLVSDGNSEWGEFNAWIPFDAPVPEVAAMFRMIRNHSDLAIIITTGRTDVYRIQMSSWLEKHDLWPDRLFMRNAGDRRVDSTVKLEIYRRFIEPEYDVQLVVDDRPQVVEMWRSIGLPVIAVTDPVISPPILAL
jgi:hypothetical protein